MTYWGLDQLSTGSPIVRAAKSSLQRLTDLAGKLHSGLDSQLAEHAPEMSFDCLGRDEQSLSDVTIRQPPGREASDPRLARGSSGCTTPS